MGNTLSGGSGSGRRAAAAEEWKGPFSDEEYACLEKRFQQTVATGQSPHDIAASVQKWLALSVPEGTTSELTGPLERLGERFLGVCKRQRLANGDDVNGQLTMRDFAQAAAQCMRASSQAILHCFFQLFATNEDDTSLTEQALASLAFASLLMADGEAVQEDVAASVTMASALARSAMNSSSSSDSVSQDEFVRWAGAQCPLLYTIFVSWMARRCFDSLARPSYSPPTLSHQSSILSRSHFVGLSTTTAEVQNSLDRLYTSAQDGLSFNRLCYHVLGYTGPTLVLIQDADGVVFGMFCDTEWKESSRFYGGSGCFLFRAVPDLRVFRVSASGASENYMYLNSKGYALPRGLGMGGDTNEFRIFLSEDFDENSYTTPKCLSFEPGSLSGRKHFVINAMEVWGCGGDASRTSQQAHRQETADLINRARKVDKAQFLGSDFDKEMFLSKTFGHGGDRGRIADDEEH